MVNSNTVHMKSEWQGGSYTFSGEKFDDFSRIFQDPTLIYMSLPPTKQDLLLKALFWVWTRSHAEKPDNARGAWKHVQTRHSLSNSGSMDMCESNETWKSNGKKNQCFHTFCKDFENFILSCIPEHLFSFTLELFRFCSIKKSRTFKNQNQFQILSRPLNRTPEIQGLSRCILTLKWPY